MKAPTPLHPDGEPVDLMPDEFPQPDDDSVVAIVEARLGARTRGEFPPTELHAYRLISKWNAERKRNGS